MTVKHKKNFVDPNNSLIHTQTIENRWGQIKGMMKKRGKVSRTLFCDKVQEIVWRIMNKEHIKAKLLEIIRYNSYQQKK